MKIYNSPFVIEILIVSIFAVFQSCAGSSENKSNEEKGRDAPIELQGRIGPVDSLTNFDIVDALEIDSFPLFKNKPGKKIKRAKLSAVTGFVIASDIVSPGNCNIPGPGGFCYRQPVRVSTLVNPSDILDHVDVRNIDVGRLNGGIHTDFVYTGYNLERMKFILGSGDGTFWGTYTWTTGDGPNDIALGDFNNDGRTDVIVTNDANNRVRIRWGHTNWNNYNSYSTGQGPRAIAVGDLNSDNYDDFITHNILDNTLTIGLKNPTGGFSLSNYGSGAYNAYNWDIKLADVNSDGDLDMVYSYNYFSDEGPMIAVRINDGNGAFGTQIYSESSLGHGNYINSMTLADFNEDGNLDVVATTLLDILEKGGKKHDFCVNHNIKEDAFSTPTQI